jgi:hypothetical protein
MAYFLIKIVSPTAWLDRPVGVEARFPSETMALDREAPLVATGERDLAENCVNPTQKGCSGQNKCDQLVHGFSTLRSLTGGCSLRYGPD